MSIDSHRSSAPSAKGILATLVALGTAMLLLACNSDGAPGPAPAGTTPSPLATSEVTPTQSSTGTIRPADPSPAPATATPEPFDHEAFLAQRGLVPGEQPVEADVTGDGRPETLLNAHIPECASCRARTFFVLSGDDVLFEAGGSGWLAPLEDGSGFEWVFPLPMPADPLCCPSWFAVETYRWDGAAFALDKTVALRHFLEVNDMPVTDPLSPPPQLATVVLHYTQIDRGHLAQAYALFSNGFQQANALTPGLPGLHPPSRCASSP